MKTFLLNQFIKDIAKYKFIVKSPEFQVIFNEKLSFMSIPEFDNNFKPVLATLKAPDFMRKMLSRYQEIYKINITEVSTSHLQTCRDFITRF